jgi:hypothetical protein
MQMPDGSERMISTGPDPLFMQPVLSNIFHECRPFDLYCAVASSHVEDRFATLEIMPGVVHSALAGPGHPGVAGVDLLF